MAQTQTLKGITPAAETISPFEVLTHKFSWNLLCLALISLSVKRVEDDNNMPSSLTSRRKNGEFWICCDWRAALFTYCVFMLFVHDAVRPWVLHFFRFVVAIHGFCSMLCSMLDRKAHQLPLSLQHSICASNPRSFACRKKRCVSTPHEKRPCSCTLLYIPAYYCALTDLRVNYLLCIFCEADKIIIALEIIVTCIFEPTFWNCKKGCFKDVLKRCYP